MASIIKKLFENKNKALLGIMGLENILKSASSHKCINKNRIKTHINKTYRLLSH
jgi:hypothetical protein